MREAEDEQAMLDLEGKPSFLIFSTMELKSRDPIDLGIDVLRFHVTALLSNAIRTVDFA